MNTDKVAKLLVALKEVRSWNNSDIRGFEDISPDMAMLKARRSVITKALREAGE